jgi:hypothetical protein
MGQGDVGILQRTIQELQQRYQRPRQGSEDQLGQRSIIPVFGLERDDDKPAERLNLLITLNFGFILPSKRLQRQS